MDYDFEPRYEAMQLQSSDFVKDTETIHNERMVKEKYTMKEEWCFPRGWA